LRLDQLKNEVMFFFCFKISLKLNKNTTKTFDWFIESKVLQIVFSPKTYFWSKLITFLEPNCWNTHLITWSLEGTRTVGL